MNVTVHQRPGVYSAYEASSGAGSAGRGGVVGLVGSSAGAKNLGQVQMVTGYDKAVAAFGDGGMAELIRLALRNGASAVAAVAVKDQAGYAAGLEALEAEENITAVLCDSTDAEVQKKLRDSVVQASEARRERLAVLAGGAEESVDELIRRAAGLNCERVVLVAPGGVDQSGGAADGLAVAAAVAGAIAGESDPAVPLGGAELAGLAGLARRYSDKDLDRLILGGVTAVEESGGVISVVRGVTTRTTSGGAADGTWRELSTIRIVDDVIPGLRSALRAKFRRAKNTEQSRSAIRAQVVLELENKLAREIITGYDGVTVTADREDPSRCLVDFSFTAAHGLNQIWLTAHITV